MFCMVLPPVLRSERVRLQIALLSILAWLLHFSRRMVPCPDTGASVFRHLLAWHGGAGQSGGRQSEPLLGTQER
jgi:hypothetical protein